MKIVGFDNLDAGTTGTVVYDSQNNPLPKTFNSGSYSHYVISFYPSGANNYFKRIQIEEGSSATQYEKFVGGSPSPNPDYPQDIRVVTGSTTVMITGKNLLSQNPVSTASNGISGENVGDYLRFSGTATSTWANITRGSVMCLPPATYTFSINEQKARRYAIKCTLEDGTVAEKRIEIGSTSVSFTTTKKIVGAYVYVACTNGEVVNELVKLQLEKSSQATEFDPYRRQEYSISLGSLELCKIGDYQDYFYKSGDKWYVHKEIDTSTVNGSEAWEKYSDGYFYAQNSLPDNPINAAIVPYCATLKGCTSSSGIADFISESASMGYATNVHRSSKIMRIKNQDILSANDLKTWLASNPVTVYYVLQTPTDTEITNEALKAQLNAISQANAYRGRTHIDASAASGNVPHIIAAEVTTDPSGTITNSGNIYSKPKLTIFGSGNVGVYLNGVQMFQIALGTNDYITIDTALMEAYKDNLQTLKNRSVTGDYNNFKLPVGESEISFSGSVTMCVVENYSRWL